MRQPAPSPAHMKDKTISGATALGSSPYLINPAYASVSPLLDSFLAYRISTTTTLLRGQLAGQFIAPSELLRSQSSRSYTTPAAIQTADAAGTAATDNAKTAAVKRLTRVLNSDRESVQSIGQPRLTAQKA